MKKTMVLVLMLFAAAAQAVEVSSVADGVVIRDIGAFEAAAGPRTTPAGC